jgi:ribosome-associated protein
MTDDRWLPVSRSCRIDLDELDFQVSRSGGPGGQHANTSNTRVDVVFDIRHSRSLTPGQRARLQHKLGAVVRATAADSRSQARNRDIALERLRARIAAALHVDPPRRATKPSRTARAKRVDAKRRRGQIKRGRARPAADD